MIKIIYFIIRVTLKSNPNLTFNTYMASGILHNPESISSPIKMVKKTKPHILRELNEMLI